jgi:hypothetical protein
MAYTGKVTSPESLGRMLTRMAQQAGVPAHDTTGVLRHYGRDVAGALTLASRRTSRSSPPILLPDALRALPDGARHRAARRAGRSNRCEAEAPAKETCRKRLL